jgi:chromosome segregation ATPase
MGSKVLKQKLYEYEATLKHRDSQLKELQDILNSKDVEIRQLRELTEKNEKKIEDIRGSMSDHPKERAAEPGGEDKEKLIQAKEQEWEFKINEQKVQMNGIMAEKDASIKRLEELLRNRETELERLTSKDNYYKKQIEAKEKLLKIARSATNEKQKEIDILGKRLNNKEQEFKFITDELKIEMSSLLTEKDNLIKKLEGSLKVKEGELERKYSEEKESKKQMQGKEQELTTIRSAMNQKEQEILELTTALKNKEQELRSSKSEMSTTLRPMGTRAIAVKGRSFWETLKAFFRVDRMENH